jgi:hypothetical protein
MLASHTATLAVYACTPATKTKRNSSNTTIQTISVWLKKSSAHGEVRFWSYASPEIPAEALRTAQALVRVPEYAWCNWEASEYLTELLNDMLKLVCDGRFDNLR